MKKNIVRIALSCCLIGGMMMATMACSDKDSKKCKSSKPYYCSSAKVCCKYRYYDGQGTCYSSMSSCASSGNACATCWLEDDD